MQSCSPLWTLPQGIGRYNWISYQRRKLPSQHLPVIMSSMSCPFGLTNAPTTFQHLMECVLPSFSLAQRLIYLDDSIVYLI